MYHVCLHLHVCWQARLQAAVFGAKGQRGGAVKPPHPEADAHKLSVRLPLLRAVFQQLDEDKSGSVSSAELASFGQYIGHGHWTPESMAKIMDSDGDGSISITEFQVLLLHLFFLLLELATFIGCVVVEAGVLSLAVVEPISGARGVCVVLMLVCFARRV